MHRPSSGTGSTARALRACAWLLVALPLLAMEPASGCNEGPPPADAGFEARQQAYLEYAAAETGDGGTHTQIARLSLGQPIVEQVIRDSFDKIRERRDTADFSVVGLMRLMYLFRSQLSPELVAVDVVSASGLSARTFEPYTPTGSRVSEQVLSYIEGTSTRQDALYEVTLDFSDGTTSGKSYMIQYDGVWLASPVELSESLIEGAIGAARRYLDDVVVPMLEENRGDPIDPAKVTRMRDGMRPGHCQLGNDSAEKTDESFEEGWPFEMDIRGDIGCDGGALVSFSPDGTYNAFGRYA